MLLITGGPGQDALILGKLALKIGHEVTIAARTGDGEALGKSILPAAKWITLDLRDRSSCGRALRTLRPSTIFNFAGISSVASSWQDPLASFDTNLHGCLNLLDEIRIQALSTRFWQAGSSEMYDRANKTVDEDTPYEPSSPYGVSKAQASTWVKFYRMHYGVDAGNLIMFNHESPLRRPEFLWMTILTQLRETIDNPTLQLSNPEVSKDWSWAVDFMKFALKTIDLPSADDYVLGSGQLTSVTQLAEAFANSLGIERPTILRSGSPRPNDAIHPVANPSRANSAVVGLARTDLNESIDAMVRYANTDPSVNKKREAAISWLDSI